MDHRPAPPPSADASRSNWELLLAGEPYVVDEEIATKGRLAARLADEYHRAWTAGEAGAEALLARLLGRLGEGVVVRPPLFVDFGERIAVGERTFINCNLTALDVAPITIGADWVLLRAPRHRPQPATPSPRVPDRAPPYR